MPYQMVKRFLCFAKTRWPSVRGNEIRTQSAEALAAKAKAERLAILETKVFDGIARGLEANIDVGRGLIEIRDNVGHGEWEAYYAKKFAPRGIALRTAQQYMKMARDADAVSKNADSALFPPAGDPEAQAISEATEAARTAVAIAGGQLLKTSKSEIKKRVRLDGIYRLPLYITGEEKDATDELRKSKEWYYAEIEIIELLKRLHIKYGIVNDPATREVEATPPADKRPANIPAEADAEPYPAASAEAAHTGGALEEKSYDEDLRA
jgi:hypothetical protein